MPTEPRSSNPRATVAAGQGTPPSPPDEPLLEREGPLEQLRAALASAATGTGRVCLVAGEAGAGKTTLLHAVAASARGARAFWGACDPLHTPRVLGPVRDLARQIGGDLSSLVLAGASTDAIFAALLDALEAARVPSLLVIEDIHWADEATLDVLMLLGRRVAPLPAVLALTYRDDELAANPALEAFLGTFAPSVTTRIALAPLSAGAVAELARVAGRSAEGLHALTRGNPFFVHELLATPGERLPATVRDAVLSRVRRLSASGLAALELAAVVPGSAEVELLRHSGADLEALPECVQAGLLRVSGRAVEFRHELARRAVEGSIGELRRRALHARTLATLAERHETIGDVPLARLVHHAAAADDDGAVLRFAPPAAREASRAAAHREALQYYAQAVAHAGSLPPEDRAELLEGYSYEAYLCARVTDAIRARADALAAWQALGRSERVGAAQRWLSRLHWWAGQPVEAEAAGEAAVRVLEALPPSHELAMAYSNLSQLHMLSRRAQPALEWGGRAVALARTLGDQEALTHALTNVGTVGLNAGAPEAVEQLEEAFAIGNAAGLEDHAARALVNRAYSIVDRRDLRTGEPLLERALSYARAHDLDAYAQYLTGVRAEVRLERGDWAGAESDARGVLSERKHAGVTDIPALIALGTLQARRGDAGAADTLAEARARADPTGEMQRIAPVAAALAELAWLEGDTATVDTATGRALLLATEAGDPWWFGELAFWRWRAGLWRDAAAGAGGQANPRAREIAPAQPYRLALAGAWRAAAAAWNELGAAYHRAEALADGDDNAAAEALRFFDRVGATRRAAVLRGRLRAEGRRVPVGARRTTRANPAGLTRREAQVLALLAEGLTNPVIATRLFLSPRTVEHHVSAVLRKLGCASRRDAPAAARALGLDVADE